MVTLATLEQATAREVFDQVKAHLLKQNEQCYDDGRCLYRHAQLKCAAGCLISDEEYNPSMEDSSWGTLVDKQIVPNNHKKLIAMLQDIHDNRRVTDWEIYLNELEKELSL